MTDTIFNGLKKNPVLIPLFALLFALHSCQYLTPLTSLVQDRTPSDPSTDSVLVDTVYIQSFTGQNLNEVRSIFFDTFKEQNSYSFVELLPDDLSKLGIVRLEVKDYAIWENEELIPIPEDNVLSTEKTFDIIIRRNAIVSIGVSLFEAESGKQLVRRLFSQPFQQIYLDERSVAQRPEERVELQRLTKILVFRILESFHPDRADLVLTHLEPGKGHNWVSRTFYDLGDRRIKKGNRLALAGDMEQAIWLWKIVLFESGRGETEAIYLQNRASAYYNLGNLYSHTGNWLLAAEMYSHANRLQQKLKYAQAWGENMQLWLDEQKSLNGKKASAQKPEYIARKDDEMPISSEEVIPERIKNIEQNRQLLLKAKDLWPLDPNLKNQKPKR